MKKTLIPLTAALALACAAPLALARDAVTHVLAQAGAPAATPAPATSAPATSAPATSASPTPASPPAATAPAATAPAASATDAQRPAAQAPSETRKAAPARRVIDVNTASEQELMTLHGIGEARARAIVDGRPYERKDDLVRRKVIPKGVYDRIRDRIVAKRGG